jgi:hypothetical protein
MLDGKRVNAASIRKIYDEVEEGWERGRHAFFQEFFIPESGRKQGNPIGDSNSQKIFRQIWEKITEYEKNRDPDLFSYGYEGKELTEDDPKRGAVLSRARSTANLWMELVQYKDDLTEEQFERVMEKIMEVYDSSPVMRQMIEKPVYKDVVDEIKARKE